MDAGAEGRTAAQPFSAFASSSPSPPRILPLTASRHQSLRQSLPSDYPHWDSAFPEAVNELRERQDVSDQRKRKIFCDNLHLLYGFTVDPADCKA